MEGWKDGREEGRVKGWKDGRVEAKIYKTRLEPIKRLGTKKFRLNFNSKY